MTKTDGTVQPARHRVIASLRNAWRNLTSMGTALVLLFLLALGAIPGALLPQNSLNAQAVREYIAERPTLGPILDRFGMFDVFSSFWFTAIYALLFVSLVGCIIPRAIDHWHAMRASVVRVPRNLGRLPHHSTLTLPGTADEAEAKVLPVFRRWRRTVRRDGDVIEVSAEKGHLREAGNLVFHIALLGVLASVALGRIFGYEGSVIVVANGGPGICTGSPAVYDSFRAGLSVDGTDLTPFCVRVNDFRADYLATGQAEMFTSNIEYQAGDDLLTNEWNPYTLRVNDPLRVEGDRLYLIGHGFAPRFTVTFPNGESRSETLQFAPEDATTFLSSGAMRFDPPAGLYPDQSERRQNQIAIEGLFAPTAFFEGDLLTSVFPAMNDPAVAIDIYKGDIGLDAGRPQNIFALDQSMIEQERLVRQARVNLMAGESTTLDDGTEVRFDGAEEWVSLQVSHDPAQGWVLASAIAMTLGLVVSLLVTRRRVWVRISPDLHAPTAGERRTVVEIGGLARTDQAGWGSEFERVCTRISAPRSSDT
ncbi:cytochrome c biogenesis protein ResB [Hoyosella subflava]|uniref:Putative cytochrome c biogenesis protein ResB n=1 Tax=Hoyosella subflava (strain DSM 45089 / JCM 17490 / NBRC 109087 / DQS3-9A1) TaxID=443218 RepID=F6EGZ8_HOYSD|nr:cytochrome c biogenesis protein ResB [Hoyosella subflava]AEF38822.1 Putative cytochrome c biogenesis protein ResB [Hoyosella subflava DQS3-9A1]